MGSDAYLAIKLKYNNFTLAQKKLADFVLNNADFVLNQSISEVADACDVGEATISRFCRMLGFKGYHDFKLSIVKYLPQDAPDEQDKLIGGAISEGDSITAAARYILERDIEALNETVNIIKGNYIDEAVNLLTNANRIVFFGVGASLTVALMAFNKFARITPNVTLNIESHMQYVTASLMAEGDVAVIVSHSGSTKEVVELAKTVKARGAKIICVTRFLKSPLTQYADITLLYSTSERLVHGSSLSSELSELFMLDLLYVEYYRKNYDSSCENRDTTTAVLSDKLY